ncbi:hypothetical protein BDV93DRAFT_563086 [Ceratobasidium sp. AG-I]|nr:hypothetical protein BDV93DRAFT_563086 [Ceratobasidium sp. AG-I]
MTDSFSFTYDPRWGVGIDEYLESNKQFSLAKYPIDRVLSAIKTVTTNDPPGTISDATFEAILSIAYYPEHLGLLDVEFCTPFYEIFDEYLNQRFKLLERSFGVLLMQVHGIFTMVEFLVVSHKLKAFVESLARSRTRGVDVFHQLSLEAVRTTGLDKSPSINTATNFFHTLLPTLRGHHIHSFSATYLLLEDVFKARDGFSKVYSRIPGFGWPLVLLKMWPKLQFFKDELEGARTKVERLGQLRDLASRCLLVAPPPEKCVVGTLAWELDCKGGDPLVREPFEKPVDLDDLEMVAGSLLFHLSTRPARNTIGGLRNLNVAAQYAFHLARMVDRFEIYPRLLQAGYVRLWTEITCAPSSRYPVDDVVSLGVGLLGYTCEGCVMSKQTSRSKATTTEIALSLFAIDFVNLLGRLFLSYTLGAGGSSSEVAGSAMSESQGQIISLDRSIAKYTKSLRSTFEPHYFDWLKVLRYVSQLQFMSLPSSRFLAPHFKQFISFWHVLGNEVGWSDQDHVASPCSYARCPGFEAVSCQSLACGKCLETTYCSARCQQLDWAHGDRPHRESCEMHIRGIKLAGEVETDA